MTESKQQPIVEDIWREKYRWRGEASYEETCARAVHALCEGESEEFRSEAVRAAQAREIVPAGRELAGAGTDKRVTLINCFGSDDIQDSMATEPDRPGLGIMDALAAAAYTQQMSGGIGMDFSTIRPRGAVVRRTQSVSTGTLPFMRMWDSMCETVRSSGSRRGAMMATLGIWHPDIEELIEAKHTPGVLTNFNVSVLVPDAFMRALEDDAFWDLTFSVPKADGDHVASHVTMEHLGTDPSGTQISIAYIGSDKDQKREYVYKRVRARDLWDKIIGSTYVHAEPGIIFIDRINQRNNLAYCEHIHVTNPCGEQPLPANGDCDLGHVNLAVMVDHPFTGDAVLARERVARAVRIMVRLLDNVLDVTLWPTEAQGVEAKLKRRIGLGYTGLGSALQQLGIPYGSSEAAGFTRSVTEFIAVEAYRASVALARERGAFPKFDKAKFMDRPFVVKMPGDVQQGIAEHGIRNGVLLSIAPTGTTSLAVGNVSSGIEPVFAHSYRRKVRGDAGELDREYDVWDYGYLKYCEHRGVQPRPNPPAETLPEGFVTADQLTVEQHLLMAAAAQEWVDAGISKTINCPTSMTLDEFREVYARAYALGLKGCTTYRPDPSSGRGSVLDATPTETPGEDAGANAPSRLTRADAPVGKLPMQEVAEGRRYRVKWPQEDCAYYIMITDYIDDRGRRRPNEIFISTKSARHDEWVKAVSLMITAIFRRAGDPTFVVDELKQVFSASGGEWVKSGAAGGRAKFVPSLVAAIGEKIEEHFRWLGLANDEEGPPPTETSTEPSELMEVCMKCGARAVVYSEGCTYCRACGHTDCG